MSFTSVAIAGQAFAETNMGESFSIGNANYTGVVSMIASDPLLELQGIRPKQEGVIVANKAQFASAPAKRANLVYSNTTYSVREVITDTQAYTLQIVELT